MPRGFAFAWRRPSLLLPIAGCLLVSAAVPAHLGSPSPTRAEDVAPLNEVRALNFAREFAVRLNGGLSVYRPEQCMFTTSAASNPCLIKSDSKGFTYRFRGGSPGWLAEGRPATVETELKVSRDGRSLVKLIYNGAPR